MGTPDKCCLCSRRDPDSWMRDEGATMAGFMGADTAALRDTATIFRDRGRQLEELRDRLTSIVQREDIWTGPDADSFRSQWQGIGSRLDSTAADVQRYHGDLETQAEEQDDASEEKGAFDAIMDFFESIKDGVVNGIKGAWKLWKSGKAFSLFNDLKNLGKAGYEGLKALIQADYIEDLKNLAKSPGTKILDFAKNKGWTKLADLTESFFDSPLVKGTGKFFAKALPVVDIGMGIHQIVNAEDGWDVASGGLSVLSGGLMLAAPMTGPFAPLVAGAGLVAGGVSLAIDAGKAVVENWDTITETAANAWEATTDVASDVWNGAKNFVNDGLNAIGSIFS